MKYSRPRISNVWEKSTFQIRQNYPAPLGFLPEPDLENAGFRPELELKSDTAVIESFPICDCHGNLREVRVTLPWELLYADDSCDS